MLYQKELIELFNKYHPEWVEIETNGTRAPMTEFALNVA